jgi:hypothetical protein
MTTSLAAATEANTASAPAIYFIDGSLSDLPKLLPDVVIGVTTANGFATSLKWGQSFAATVTGEISAVRFATNNALAGGTLKIYAGEGLGGTLLGTQTGINLADTVTSTDVFTFSTINLTTPVAITSGSQYTFYFETSGSVGRPLIKFSADVYTAGKLYLDTTAYPTFNLSFEVVQSDSVGDTTPPTFDVAAAPPASPPVLDASKSPTLGSTAANLAAPSNGSTASSVLVSSLIDSVNGSGLDNYTDANNEPAGIAITQVSTNGTLYFSTNGGTDWAALTGTVSAISALALYADANTRVYFKPNANYSGSLLDAITFKAWDQTGGFTNGQTAVSTTLNLTLAGTYDTPGRAFTTPVVVGNTAYVADLMGGLQIIDVSNPVAPTLLANFGMSGVARGVAVLDNMAYVAMGNSGLQIINVTNPAALVNLGSFNTVGDATTVALSGTTAYVADSGAGLQIINVTNPAAPQLLGTFQTQGAAYGVTVVGSTAYVAGLYGLEIINISTPSVPTSVGAYASPNAYGVAVVGNKAYVAAKFGLEIIDISSPGTPTRLSSLDLGYQSYGVVVVGNTAYLANSAVGLQVIDVSNPRSPVLLNTYDTTGVALGVAVNGNMAYVSDFYSGLQVINLPNPANSPFSTATDTVALQVVANSAANTFANTPGMVTFTDAKSNSFALSLSGAVAPLTRRAALPIAIANQNAGY